MPALPTAKIGIPAIASILPHNLIFAENAVVFDEYICITALNGGSVTTFTLNNQTITVPAFRHVIFLITLEGEIYNAYVTPCTNRFTPVILKSNVGVAVVGIAYTNDGAATNQIYIRSFGTSWTEKTFDNISNANNGNPENNDFNLNLLAEIDQATHNLYLSFAYKTATPLSFTGISGDSFVFPDTSGNSYQAIMRVQGSSGLISHNYIFNVPNSDFLGGGYIIKPGLSIVQMVTNGTYLHCLVSCDISSNYYVDKIGLMGYGPGGGIGGEPNELSIIQSTSKMAIIEFTSTLGFSVLLQNSLILYPEYSQNSLEYYNNTHLISSIIYGTTTQQTIAGKTVPATFTSNENYTPHSMIMLIRFNDWATFEGLYIQDISLIARPTIDGTQSLFKLISNISTLNNNICVQLLDLVSSNETSYVHRHSFARYTIQNNTTLVQAYETTVTTETISYNGAAAFFTLTFSNNYVYAVGSNNRVANQYKISDGSAVYTKTLPTYTTYIRAVSAETLDNALIVLGNINTSQQETYDYNVTFASTSGADKSFFLKFSHQSVTLSFNVNTFTLTISNIPKINASGQVSLFLWMYATDSNNTVQTNPNMIYNMGPIGPATSGSSYSQIFNINQMPPRFAFLSSLYVNNTNVNISDRIIGSKSASPIFTSNIIANNNLTTETTPATLKSALDTLTTNASRTTSLTTTTEEATVLIKKNTLVAAPKPLIPLSKTTINDIQVPANVYGIMTKATTNFENDGGLSMTLKLIKLDSSGNKIISKTNDATTFDTIIVTLPKPTNNIISINHTDSSGVTINDVANINISTGATTYLYNGQNLTIISQTTTSVKLQYIGPFETNTFDVGQPLNNFNDATSGPVVENPQPCLPAGTRVLTPAGYKAVETLQTGDKVITSKNKAVPVRVYKTALGCATKVTAPYYIPANTFGSNPAMTLSPDHAFKIGSNLWQIPQYAAQRYTQIQQVGIDKPITYYHLEAPDYFSDNLVIEGGAVVESYGARQIKKGFIVYSFNAKLGGFERRNGAFARRQPAALTR